MANVANIEVIVSEDESFDRAFGRFKKICSKEGIIISLIAAFVSRSTALV